MIEHTKRALSDETDIFPPEYTEWRDIAVRSSLTDRANPDTWFEAWDALLIHRIPDAVTLEMVSLLGIQTIAETYPFGYLAAPLWQAVRVERGQYQGIPAPVVMFRANLDTVPEALRAPSVELPQVGVEYEGVKDRRG